MIKSGAVEITKKKDKSNDLSFNLLYKEIQLI